MPVSELEKKADSNIKKARTAKRRLVDASLKTEIACSDSDYQTSDHNV
ncbi:MAG: hypothetical protein ACR2PX_19605 [Endozoicomonas sp.]